MADDVSSDSLTFEGSEPLKSLSEDAGVVRVGAYAIRFAAADEKDLTGDYFTKSTDFGPGNGDGAVAMFNHGQPLVKGVKALDEVAGMTFGAIKTTRDDVGIFVEANLNTANWYEKAIADLCAKGKLKWSTGTAAHLLRKNADGEITRWHIIESSYTPKPAEFRLPAIRPLKAVEMDAADLAQITEALNAPAPAPAVDKPARSVTEPTPTPTISQSAMTEAEQLEARTEAIKSATTVRLGEINEIAALGAHFKCVDEATDFIKEGKSVNDFRQHVLENVKKARVVTTTPNLGMSKGDVKSYSLVKAARDIALNGTLSGLELEASEATAKAIGKSAKGFFIPADVAGVSMAESHDLGATAVKALVSALATKNLNQTTFSQGGALVGTNILTGSIIELLRNKPLMAQMGAMTLTGLVGNVAIPRITGGATAYWLSEQGTVPETDQSFGQLGLTPKRLVGDTAYTKELINQTDLSVEALVRNDLTTVLAIAKDLAAIAGTGGAQPLGILNTTGIGSVNFAGTATRAKAIEFQKDVAVGNASRGALAYLTTPGVSAAWMNLAEAANYPSFLWKGNIDEGQVVGRPGYTTNQVPGDKVIYGNFNDLIMADWAGLDVVVNPYTYARQGLIEITITLWADIGVRHAVSFAVSSDSGAQ